MLQSVVATPGVREHFMFAPPRVRVREAAAEGELTATLRSFVRELHEGGRPERPIQPREMLQAVANLDARYARHGAEQDSHEVLRLLLEGIRAEEVELTERLRDREAVRQQVYQELQATLRATQ